MTVAVIVVTAEKTMCVTLRMGIVPMDVNNIGLDQSVMVGKEYLQWTRNHVFEWIIV